MAYSVLVDFDGTIALEDTTDLVLERFAVPQWRNVEADWVAGRIGSRECLSRQIDFVHASHAELDQLADGVALDPAFPQFVAAGRELGLSMAVASDGFDRIILRALARINVTLPVVSNRLVPMPGDRWRAEFPNFFDHCRSQSGNCKCSMFEGVSAPVILIGDGRSDFCPAAQASLVLAKKPLAAHCRDKGIDHIQIESFSDATRALRAFCRARKMIAPVPADETGAFHA
jgi:2-hydroxy-3-keto-5-methylthiopentenyl-1-phosphate phosphatase